MTPRSGLSFRGFRLFWTGRPAEICAIPFRWGLSRTPETRPESHLEAPLELENRSPSALARFQGSSDPIVASQGAASLTEKSLRAELGLSFLEEDAEAKDQSRVAEGRKVDHGGWGGAVELII